MEENYLPAEEQEAEKNLPFQTKNALNNSSVIAKGFGFSKPEKLKKKAVIDDIFLKGKAIQKNSFAFLYLEQSNTAEVPVQAMFAVSKRNFKHATDRNRVKRLMREAWRTQKSLVYQKAMAQQKQYAVCVMFKGKEIPEFTVVQLTVKELLERFCKSISTPQH